MQLLGIDVRDEVRSAPQDFVRDTGITYPSIYDPPGRSLLALKGYPRSVVPSTIVLDRHHRVAAVFLTALSDTDLLPVVQRIAADRRHRRKNHREPDRPGRLWSPAAGRTAGDHGGSGAVRLAVLPAAGPPDLAYAGRVRPPR